jgi:hypothetical protein
MGTKRRRLEGRLNRLTQLYSWGELEADEYRRQMTETRAMLAELPDPDKLIAFDRNRRILVSMAENVEKATRPQLAELVQLLVERVQAKDRTVDPASIEWTPPARPFFGEVRWYGAPGRARGSDQPTGRRSSQRTRELEHRALAVRVLQCAVPPPCSWAPMSIRVAQQLLRHAPRGRGPRSTATSPRPRNARWRRC